MSHQSTDSSQSRWPASAPGLTPLQLPSSDGLDLDIAGALTALAHRSPIFHSEADFQQQLGWAIRERHPEVLVEAEIPFRALGQPDEPGTRRKRRSLDLLVSSSVGRVALELKYPTSQCESSWGGRTFVHVEGAADLSRYEIYKDIKRLELITACNSGMSALMVLVTNDKAIWSDPRHTRAAAFSLMPDATIERGTYAWATPAGTGTVRSGEEPITISGRYQLVWRPYSDVSVRGSGSGRFCSLVVSVPAAPTCAA